MDNTLPPPEPPNLAPTNQTAPPSSSLSTSTNTSPTMADTSTNSAPHPTKPEPNPIKPPSYASFFKDHRVLAKCEPPDALEKEEIMVVDEEELLSNDDAFWNSLLGFVVGGYANTRNIKELIKSWKVPSTFSTHRNGWIVFDFGSLEDKMKVLEGGPYSSFGRQWIIKEIPPYFAFADSCFATVPIWVNLHSLPKRCWSRRVLSSIGSQIGKPISMDMITGERKKHDGARILVEIDLTQPIVEMVSFTMPNGRVWDQPVSYEVNPVVCLKCNTLGHVETECMKGKLPRPPRGRSVGAKRGYTPKPSGEEAGNNGEKVEATTEKGKGKMDEAEISFVNSNNGGEGTSSKGWEMVPYKNFSSPMLKSPHGRIVNNDLGKKLQASVAHTIPLESRPKKLVDDSLPKSPNTFGLLYDLEEEEVHTLEENVLGARVVRVVHSMEEDDMVMAEDPMREEDVSLDKVVVADHSSFKNDDFRLVKNAKGRKGKGNKKGNLATSPSIL